MKLNNHKEQAWLRAAVTLEHKKIDTVVWEKKFHWNVNLIKNKQTICATCKKIKIHGIAPGLQV